MLERVDIVVIGAGVVGLAAARALARAGREVVIVERDALIGSGISSRNSEVIHAGVYYPPGSLKARLCVRGNEMLYAYSAIAHVPHRRCGKLIVATSEAQVDVLQSISARARSCGVHDLQWMTGSEVRAVEPAVSCVAALHSPSTGIVDSHALMVSLLGGAEAHGAVLAVRSRVVAGAVRTDGVELRIESPDGSMEIEANCVINSAGLAATAVAGSIRGEHARGLPVTRFAKGNYFSFTGKSPCSRLIYPVPEPGGLGIHLTLDLAGQARFGPDVEWLETREEANIDFHVDESRRARFTQSVRRYLPGITPAMLAPAYAGVRPKIAPPSGESDFRIQGVYMGGRLRLLNLFGIESPGLTASLAIGDELVGHVIETRRGPARWDDIVDFDAEGSAG